MRKAVVEQAGAGPSAAAPRPKKPGFMKGARWGMAGLGWAARKPFFCAVGLALLLATLGLSWLVPLGGYPAAVAVVSGIACAGAAGRALALAPPGSKAPWRSWLEPWSAGRRAWHVGRLCASLGAFMAVGMCSLQFTALVYKELDPVAGMTGWPSRGFSVALCYVLLVWLVASAAPVRGARESMASVGRVLAAPMALLGFAAFWFVFLALTDTLLSYAILLAVESAAGEGAKIPANGLAPLVAFATMLASAPALAMSAGLASLDLDPPEPREPEEPRGMEGGPGGETGGG